MPQCPLGDTGSVFDGMALELVADIAPDMLIDIKEIELDEAMGTEELMPCPGGISELPDEAMLELDIPIEGDAAGLYGPIGPAVDVNVDIGDIEIEAYPRGDELRIAATKFAP